MYTIYWFRNGKQNTTTMSDLRGACIVAYNSVFKLGADEAFVTSAETGEILKEYTKG